MESVNLSVLRAKHLHEFADFVANAKSDNALQFKEILQTVLQYGLLQKNIADSLQISRVTFGRWVNGRSLPRSTYRKVILHLIEEVIRKEMDNIKR
jgi:hypothetical protein